MAFTENNKHFINHLFREVKTFSLKEKAQAFNAKRPELITRIKESYESNFNKNQLYSEILDVLSSFDPEYFLFNLFYDNDSAAIINSLKQNPTFLNLTISNNKTFIDNYYTYITSTLSIKERFNQEDELKLLKNLLHQLTGIREQDWQALENYQDANLLIKKYSNWFADNCEIQESQENVLTSLFLITKIWNYFDNLSAPFNNKMAILLYANFLNDYEKRDATGETKNISTICQMAKHTLSDLFVSLKYIPFIDIKESVEYKNGYLFQRDRFLNLVKHAELLNSINPKLSFLELIQVLNLKEDSDVFDKAQLILDKKINHLEIPNNQELLDIKEMSVTATANKFKRLIFKRMYRYDLINA